MKKIFTSLALVATLFARAGSGPTISTGLVISQVYNNGGSAGATYANKFFELYNPTAAPISTSGLSLQYASSVGGTISGVFVLPAATIPAGRYYLIQGAANAGGGGNPLPTPDAISTINSSGTGGKIYLVNGTTSIGASVCTGANIIDMLGYGSPTCAEGTPASAGNLASSIIRTAGNIDTDNNNTDFTVMPNPVARNSAYFVAPVTLESFSALKMNTAVQFHWKAATTAATVQFELQRSSDNRSFSNVYAETATQARCQSPFNYTDATPLAGVSYYRLKITDVDGAVSYSNTATLKFDNASGIYLSPAVTVSETQIAFSSNTVGLSTWMIHDISGRLVKKFTYQVTVGENRIPVNVSDLPKGQYQVSGATVEGRTPVLRMIKQ
ncbi:MAG: Endonuclease/exonuclease/phosphatase [Ferruginibacter sp.]|nr:Endonuclease/exonuclease/phosphatase [Ferruginibacter sp.]